MSYNPDDLEEGEIPDIPPTTEKPKNDINHDVAIKRKRNDESQYDSKNHDRNGRSSRSWPPKHDRPRSSHKDYDHRSNSHSSYNRSVSNPMQVNMYTEDAIRNILPPEATQIFPFPSNNHRICPGFPAIRSHPYDYIRINKAPSHNLFKEWSQNLDESERTPFPPDVSEILSLSIEYNTSAKLLHILICDQNDNILMDKNVIKFRNDGYLSEHHQVDINLPRREEIQFGYIRKHIKEAIYKRNPCILLIFDLNQPFKRVLGLHELGSNVFIRDIGRFPLIVNDFSNYKHKTIIDMVGTELTRNKLYFENENDNNIKPYSLLQNVCRNCNYQYNHRDNAKQSYCIVTVNVTLKNFERISGQGLASNKEEALDLACEDLFRNTAGKDAIVLDTDVIDPFLDALNTQRPITALVSSKLMRYLYKSLIYLWEYWVRQVTYKKPLPPPILPIREAYLSVRENPYLQSQMNQQNNPYNNNNNNMNRSNSISPPLPAPPPNSMLPPPQHQQYMNMNDRRGSTPPLYNQPPPPPHQQQQQQHPQYPPPNPNLRQTPPPPPSNVVDLTGGRIPINPVMQRQYPPPSHQPLPLHFNNNNNNMNYNGIQHPSQLPPPSPYYPPPQNNNRFNNNNPSGEYNGYPSRAPPPPFRNQQHPYQIQPPPPPPQQQQQLQRDMMYQNQPIRERPINPQQQQQQIPLSVYQPPQQPQPHPMPIHPQTQQYMSMNDRRATPSPPVPPLTTVLPSSQQQQQQIVPPYQPQETKMIPAPIQIQVQQTQRQPSSQQLQDVSEKGELIKNQPIQSKPLEQQPIQASQYLINPLCLIVDLDLTLLESTSDVNRGSNCEIFSLQQEKNGENSLKSQFHTLYIEKKINYDEDTPIYKTYVKIRPGVYEMLQELKKYYELYIFSQGDKEYVDQIMKILDPDHTLFGSRIITRKVTAKNLFEKSDSSTNNSVQTDKKSFDILINTVKEKSNHYKQFSTDQLAKISIILDDRIDVWNTSADGIDPQSNIFKVKPYHFFFNMDKRVNKDKKNDLMKSESSELEYIQCITSTLSNIAITSHKIEGYKLTTIMNGLRDVREIISEKRKSVLSDCKIVFSGIIPLTEDCRSNQVWIDAENFGAVCSQDLNEDITHVVASKGGTDKVNRARLAQKNVVNISWLYDSFWTWKKQDESKYLLPD